MSRIEKYRACAKRGMSVAATAKLYGVSARAVRQANERHNLGFKLRPNRRGRDLDAVRKHLAELTAAGKTRREMALILKAPIATITTWGRRWGIRNPAWRAKPGAGRRPLLEVLEPHLTPKEAEDLRFLRSKNYTFKDALVAIKRPDLLEGLK